ncbi:MAG: DUF1565 domain-containing protein [Nitrospirota bacterium]|nr:DUF1565 domain-containing protein [Nitrospirota bacterium]
MAGDILYMRDGTYYDDADFYYVATTGNDSNQRTLDARFKTLEKGTSVMKADDTLFVKAGSAWL